MEGVLLKSLAALFVTVMLTVADAVNVALSANPVQVKEGDPLQLTCSVDQDEGLGIVSFREQNVWKIAVSPVDTCTMIVFPNTDSRPFTMTCDPTRQRWFRLQLASVTAGEHGKVWKCDMTSVSAASGQCVVTGSSPNPCKSSNVTVFVLVPAQTVQLKQGNTVLTESSIEVREDTSAELTCDTGPGGSRPAATLTWRRRRASGGDEDITSDVTSESPTPVPGETDIMISSSRFQVNNRRYNNWQIYCTASNTGGSLSSVNVTLDVKYKADLQLRVGSQAYTEYQVVEKGGSLVLTCFTVDANPSTVSYTWKQGSTTLQESGSTLSFTTVLSSADGTYTCQSDNGYGVGVSNSMRLTVNYPPTTPTLAISTTVVKGKVSVVKDDDVAIVCTTDSKPSPDWYKWMITPVGGGGSTDGPISQQLTLNNIQTTSDGTYECQVQNTMPRTGDSALTGTNSSQITIDVLFPPIDPTFTLESTSVTGPVSVVKEDNVVITCNTVSKPSPNSYQWSFIAINGGGSSIVETTRTLTLNAIQTGSEGTYSCRVQNTMARTVGNSVTGTATSSLAVNVLFPPSNPTFTLESTSVTGPVSVVKEDNVVITCNAVSKPAPNSYQWSFTAISGGGSSIVETTRTLTLNAVQTGSVGNYSCQVQNTMARTVGNSETGTASSSLGINVLFPPSDPTFTLESMSVTGPVSVVKEDNVVITCNTVSKPAPNSYHWSFTAISGGGSSIVERTRTLTLNAVQTGNEGTYSCRVRNTMYRTVGNSVTGTATSSLGVNVLFPPSNPTFTLESTSVTGPVSVVKEDNVVITCNTVSKPAPNSYHWSFTAISGGGSSIVESTRTLTLNAIQTDSEGTYSCRAQNTMNRTVGNSEMGTATSSLAVTVLYPPAVDPFSATNNVVEGQPLRILCKVSSSNPAPNSFRWTRNNNVSWHFDGAELHISKTSRAHSDIYRCTVKNEMNRTVGQSEIGTGHQEVTVDILYRASIEEFNTTKSLPGNRTIEVNENETLNFYCVVDSHPASNMSIYRDDKTVQTGNGIKSLSKQYSRVDCLDSGQYSCSARNQYNDHLVVSPAIHLLVKCSPRLDGRVDTVTNYSKGVSDSVAFKASFVAYPEPATYNWFRCTLDMVAWEHVSTTGAINISSGGLSSTLTIPSIRENDFGNYRVDAWNEKGNTSAMFHLLPNSVPSVPSEFRDVEESATLSAITLKWTAGFSGGVNQSFVIQYKRSTDMTWKGIFVAKENAEKGLELNKTISNLESGTEYMFRIYSTNSLGNSSTSATVKATTVKPAVQDEPQNIAATVGGAVGGIGVLAIAVGVIIVFLYRRYPRRKTVEEAVELHRSDQQLEETELEKRQVPPSPALSEEQIDDQALAPANSISKSSTEHDIPISDLWRYIEENAAEGQALHTDFMKLPRGMQFPAERGMEVQNKRKNRYRDMIAYDHSRVKLPGGPENDYINASFLDNIVRKRKGFGRTKMYIGAQGPTVKTTDDFWTMIWAQKVRCIIMLTETVEAGKTKCEQYWPDGAAVTYGGVAVTLISEDVFADYTIRTLSCSKNGQTRRVTQYHFTAWPDKDVPEVAVSLAFFWYRVRNDDPKRKEPWLVHCSAGVGRTGTFICLDYLSDEGKANGSINVFQCVRQTRQMRVNMVQTKEQYLFLHLAAHEIFSFDSTIIPCDIFPSRWEQQLDDVYQNGNPILWEQYQQLEEECAFKINAVFSEKEISDEYFSSMLHQNASKTRESTVMALETYRPFLVMDADGCNDFINGVFLPTFRSTTGLIITQMPLRNTIVDFLRLIWEQNVKEVVMMNQEETENKSFGVYWATVAKTSRKFGPFIVQHVEEATVNGALCRKLKVTLTVTGEVREVTQYVYSLWQSGDVPEEIEVVLHICMELYTRQENNAHTPVIVHCMDGAERSGLFCAVYTFLQRARAVREIAIPQTLKQLRLRRPEIISSFGQYVYLYQAMLQYLRMYEVYANVEL